MGGEVGGEGAMAEGEGEGEGEGDMGEGGVEEEEEGEGEVDLSPIFKWETATGLALILSKLCTVCVWAIIKVVMSCTKLSKFL